MIQNWNYKHTAIKVLGLIGIVLCCAFLPAKYTLLKEVLHHNNQMVVDQQNNVYLFHSSGYKKYTSEGTLIYSYVSNEMGELIAMDVDVSGKVALLFKDFGSIVVIDKNNIEIGRMKTASIGVSDARLLCFSADGGIWVLDREENNLKKYDIIGHQKFNGREMIFTSSEVFKPSHMIEYAGKVFVSDPNLGIYVFDSYGNYIKTINLMGIHHFQVLNENIIFVKDAKVMSFNLNTTTQVELKGFEADITPIKALLAGSSIVLSDEKKAVFLKNNAP